MTQKDYSRRHLIELSGTVGLAGLAGCVGFGNQSANDSGSGGKQTAEMADKITVWAWDIGAKAYRLTGDPYEKQFGGQVNIKKMGHSSLVKKYKSRLLSGTDAPAVSAMEYQTAPAHIETGGLYDISDRIKQAGLKDKYLSGVWKAVSKDGGIYVLPDGFGPVAVFYRRDVYETAGIDPSSIKTWEDFIEAGKKLPNDTNLFTFDPTNYSLYWRPHYRMLGGQAFTEDGKVNIHSEKSVRVVEMLKKTWDAGVVANMKMWSPSWFTAAKEGKLAAIPSGSWMAGTLRDSLPETAGKWGVHPMPAYEKGGNNATNVGGSGLCISKQVSDAKTERAWSWMKFAITQEEMQLKMFKKFNLFPALTTTYDSEVMDQPVKFFNGQKIRRIFTKTARKVPGYRYTADTSEVENVLNVYLPKALQGNLSPEEAMTQAAKALANKTGRELA